MDEGETILRRIFMPPEGSAPVATRVDEHRDGMAAPNVPWYINPRLELAAYFTPCVGLR